MGTAAAMNIGSHLHAQKNDATKHPKMVLKDAMSIFQNAILFLLISIMDTQSTSPAITTNEMVIAIALGKSVL